MPNDSLNRGFATSEPRRARFSGILLDHLPTVPRAVTITVPRHPGALAPGLQSRKLFRDVRDGPGRMHLTDGGPLPFNR